MGKTEWFSINTSLICVRTSSWAEDVGKTALLLGRAVEVIWLDSLMFCSASAIET